MGNYFFVEMSSQEQNTSEQPQNYAKNLPNANYLDQNNQIVNLASLMNNPNSSENPINKNQIYNQNQFAMNFSDAR